MSTYKSRRRQNLDIWPGFVDALTSLILVMIFLLLLFVIGQYVFTEALSSRDQSLESLQKQLAEANQQLQRLKTLADDQAARLTERSTALAAAQDELSLVRKELDETLSHRNTLQSDLALVTTQRDGFGNEVTNLRTSLTQSLEALKERNDTIAALDQKLKLISENQISELERYRSEFFGRLKEVLAGRSDIVISGDRFVLPSDVLFRSGSAELETIAQPRLDKLAATIKEIEKKIPDKVSWVLRVDGHTDKTPIKSESFPSNWELSSARAIAIVKYLAVKGIDPRHLSANGFGPYQPRDPSDSPEALARNRRIEFQLTNR